MRFSQFVQCADTIHGSGRLATYAHRISRGSEPQRAISPSQERGAKTGRRSAEALITVALGFVNPPARRFGSRKVYARCSGVITICLLRNMRDDRRPEQHAECCREKD